MSFDFFDYVNKINEKQGIQLVKYYDKTLKRWEEGLLVELLNAKRNMWKVYFPSTFTDDDYFLAIEVKDGEPKKDYCAYRYEF